MKKKYGTSSFDRNFVRTAAALAGLVVSFALLLASVQGASSAAANDATVVFGVTWYDIGKAALEGLSGVKRVTRGWRGFTEINTVTYDRTKITTGEMEDALMKAGTYLKTMPDEEKSILR